MGRVVPGASCPWGELSMGQVVPGASCPRASFDGASCPWGELSWGEWSGNHISDLYIHCTNEYMYNEYMYNVHISMYNNIVNVL